MVFLNIIIIIIWHQITIIIIICFARQRWLPKREMIYHGIRLIIECEGPSGNVDTALQSGLVISRTPIYLPIYQHLSAVVNTSVINNSAVHMIIITRFRTSTWSVSHRAGLGCTAISRSDGSFHALTVLNLCCAYYTLTL